MNWTKKFEDEVNYTLEGCVIDLIDYCIADYCQSIDRDQAMHNGEAVYDYYILTDNETGKEEEVTAEQMEDWAKTW